MWVIIGTRHTKRLAFLSASLFCFLWLASPLSGQWRSDVYYPSIKFDSCRSKDLYLRVENLNFFDNLEYQSPHVTGATFIGLHGRAFFDYYFTPSLRMQIGASAIKYSGRTEFDRISEWFSLTYQPISLFSFTAGNIDLGTLPAISPQLYNPQYIYIEPDTKGMMLNLSIPRLESAIFINWRRFIHQNDPFQEEFFAGFTNTISPISRENFSLEIPLHLSGYHHGGEINTTVKGVETLLNSRIGATTTLKWFNTDLSLGSSLYTFYETTEKYRQNFRKGYGVETEMELTYRQATLSLSYWHSYRYYSPLGNPIFNSFTSDKPSYIFNYHDVVFLKAFYHHPIDKIGRITMDVQLGYDIARGKINFFTGLKLIISEEFFLKNMKKTN